MELSKYEPRQLINPLDIKLSIFAVDINFPIPTSALFSFQKFFFSMALIFLPTADSLLSKVSVI